MHARRRRSLARFVESVREQITRDRAEGRMSVVAGVTMPRAIADFFRAFRARFGDEPLEKTIARLEGVR